MQTGLPREGKMDTAGGRGNEESEPPSDVAVGLPRPGRNKL